MSRSHIAMKGRLKNKARARRRCDQVIEAALAGLSRDHVLEITGLKREGLKQLLYREFGSSSYPECVLSHPDVAPRHKVGEA